MPLKSARIEPAFRALTDWSYYESHQRTHYAFTGDRCHTDLAFPVPVQIPPCLCLHRVHFLRLQIQRTKRDRTSFIFAIAIPFSLMIWLSEVKSYFYLIGAIELLFIIAAAVTAIVFKPKKEDKADTPADASSEDENSTEEVSGDDSEE